MIDNKLNIYINNLSIICWSTIIIYLTYDCRKLLNNESARQHHVRKTKRVDNIHAIQ